MAYTQAFKQAAAGAGSLGANAMAGLFIPAPDAVADSQDLKADRPSLLDAVYAKLSGSDIVWNRDGLSGSAPALSPASSFLRAASGYNAQTQPPPVTNHFQMAATTVAPQPQLNGVAANVAALRDALNSPPPEKVRAHETAPNIDMNKLDQRTAEHAQTVADGRKAAQALQNLTGVDKPNTRVAFGIVAGGALTGPALRAAANMVAPGMGMPVQMAAAAVDMVRAIGAGSFGVQNNTSYSRNQPEGYSGASVAAPSPAPRPALTATGVMLSGQTLQPENLGMLRFSEAGLRQAAASLSTMNYDVRQSRNTLDKIGRDGIQVGLGEVAEIARNDGRGAVRINNTLTGGTAYPLMRGMH